MPVSVLALGARYQLCGRCLIVLCGRCVGGGLRGALECCDTWADKAIAARSS